MPIQKKYLGELLIDVGMITEQQLQECLQEQSKTKDRLGAILKSKGYVTDQQLMEVMEYQLRIPYASFDTAELSPSLSEYIPQSLARKHKMVPIKVLDKKLFLAMDDALDFIAIEVNHVAYLAASLVGILSQQLVKKICP